MKKVNTEFMFFFAQFDFLKHFSFQLFKTNLTSTSFIHVQKDLFFPHESIHMATIFVNTQLTRKIPQILFANDSAHFLIQIINFLHKFFSYTENI